MKRPVNGTMGGPLLAVTPPVARSVPKTDPRRARRKNDIVVRIDALGSLQRLVNRDRHDVRRLQCDHVTPLAVGDGAHGGASEASREQPIVARRHAAALKMTQYE